MRRAFILSCVALVALAALNFWMWRKFTLERENAAELRAALADARRANLPREHLKSATAQHVESLSGSLGPAPAPAETSRGVAAAPPPSGNVLMRKWQAHERQMLGDPEYRDSWRRSARDQFAALRADAVRVVGMTPGEADHVIDLWVERNLWVQEHGDPTGHSDMSADATAELNRRSEAEQAEVRALLGEQKYAAWSEFLRTQSERGEANFLGRQLSTTSAALDAAQIDALVVALSTERDAAESKYREYRQANGASDPFENQTDEDRVRYVEIARTANRNVHDRMAASLSPNQLEKLDAMLASRLLPIEAQLRLDAKNPP
jgi:hypothetical protein